jgi:CRAL/TRIO domain
METALKKHKSEGVHRRLSQGQVGASKQTVMRAIALFLDGMSRVIIFSFGPSLVYRLVYGGPLKLGLDCAKVALPLATLASAYLLGRGAGSSLATRYPIEEENKPKTVARLAGTAISLLVFTFGAGLQSVWWLFLIRFLSGVILGGLCVITKDKTIENGSTHIDGGYLEEQLEAGLVRKHNDFVSGRSSDNNLMPGAAKIYMTAFAVSILAGGLLYRHATGDATFRALTGSKSGNLNLSPLFLIAVTISGESVLRCFFACFESRNTTKRDDEWRQIDGRNALNTELDDILGELPPSPLKTFENDDRLQIRGDRPGSGGSPGIDGMRGRLTTSDSEFFDCQSVLSGMEDLEFFDEEKGWTVYTDTSTYVDRKCVDGSGCASYVPNGDSPSNIPANYLKLCKQDSVKAQKMWNKTQEWRRENQVWRIHCMPNTWFHDIKQAYPHFIHGVSKKGFPIIYEQPGKMNLKQLFRGGCNVDDMLRHYMFFLEFISNHICTRGEVRERLGCNAPPHSSSTWGIMVVMDVKGAGLSHLSGDVLTYLKGAGDINNSHYPLSLKRAFLVNSPFWLAGAWKSVKGILPDSVHVDILSSHQYATTLKGFIDEDQIPREYGGSSQYPLGEHPYEKMLNNLVDEAAKGERPSTPNIVSPPRDSPWKHEAPVSVGPHSRRRRLYPQTILLSSDLKDDCQPDDEDGKKKSGFGRSAPISSDILTIVSALFALWTALQGLIEIAIPLWLMTPPELGGLG